VTWAELENEWACAKCFRVINVGETVLLKGVAIYCQECGEERERGEDADSPDEK
jgi:hypothetical protein